MTEWTKAEDEIVERCAKDGYSASQIAAEVGNGRSRNSIIGRLNRLGLRLGELCAAGKPRKAPRKFNPQPTPLRQPAFVKPPAPKADPIPTAHAFVALEETQPVAFAALEEHQCKWPVGDLFCGAKRMAGRPYCIKHAATGRQEVKPPRKQRAIPMHSRRSRHW